MLGGARSGAGATEGPAAAGVGGGSGGAAGLGTRWHRARRHLLSPARGSRVPARLRLHAWAAPVGRAVWVFPRWGPRLGLRSGRKCKINKAGIPAAQAAAGTTADAGHGSSLSGYRRCGHSGAGRSSPGPAGQPPPQVRVRGWSVRVSREGPSSIPAALASDPRPGRSSRYPVPAGPRLPEPSRQPGGGGGARLRTRRGRGDPPGLPSGGAARRSRRGAVPPAALPARPRGSEGAEAPRSPLKAADRPVSRRARARGGRPCGDWSVSRCGEGGRRRWAAPLRPDHLKGSGGGRGLGARRGRPGGLSSSRDGAFVC